MKRYLTIIVIISVLGILFPVRQVHRRIVGVNNEVYLNSRNMEYYYEHEVVTIVNAFARELDQQPQNATIDRVTGAIIPEQIGLIVDVQATLELVMTAKSHTNLRPVLIEVVPLLRSEQLEQLVTTLGDFSTQLMGSPGRINNIKLSLDAINNTLLMPGEVFSFNGVVGERTSERGYKPAPVIYGESVADGVGGGICQVSSTLYNAVDRADLEIVERRIHSIAPSYIQHGKDATVAWPHTDFKFRNNQAEPIIIKGGIQGWRVRMWIVGR